MVRLRQELEVQGVSQAVLADLVGMSRGQLSDVLNGHKPASFTEVNDLARALGLSLAQIVADVEP